MRVLNFLRTKELKKANKILEHMPVAEYNAQMNGALTLIHLRNQIIATNRGMKACHFYLIPGPQIVCSK